MSAPKALPAPSRRGLIGASMSALLAGAAIATPAQSATQPGSDAELIRRCQQFAEYELEGFYGYVVTPGEGGDWDDDWDSAEWIAETPATTPEGWQAKALALSAWHRDAYDDHPDYREPWSPLLASMLRDIVAPQRNAIVARLAEKYGPLPSTYTADGIWIGRDHKPPAWSPPEVAQQPDAELFSLCLQFHRNRDVMATWAPDDDDGSDVLTHQEVAITDALIGLAPVTEAGRQAKAEVGYVVLNDWGRRESSRSVQFAIAALRDAARVVPSALVTLPAPSPDAELIGLCNRLVAIDAEYRAIYAAHDNPKTNADDDPRTKPRMDALHEEWQAIEDCIYNLPDPVTPAGVQAVARAAYAEAAKNSDGTLTANDLATWLALTVVEWHSGSAAA